MEDDNIINQKSHVKSNFDSLTHEFDEMVRELFEKNVKFGIYLPPNSKPVFDYFLDVTSGNFIEWNSLVLSVEALIRQAQTSDANSRASESIIDTIDSVRYSFLTALLLMNRNPVLVTGPSGVGKTAIIENMLKKLSTTGFSLKPNSVLGNVFNYADRTKTTMMTNVTAMMMFSDENQDAIGFKKNKSDEMSKNWIPVVLVIN